MTVMVIVTVAAFLFDPYCVLQDALLVSFSVLLTFLRGRCHYPHLTDENVEAELPSLL